MPGPADLLKLPEVAEDCGVGRNTVHRWIHAGIMGLRLRAVRVGGTWRVGRADLDNFLSELTRRSIGDGAAPAVEPGETPAALNRRRRASIETANRLGI